MNIEVIKPGARSTLQDRGRTGFQHFGVPVSGVMDEWSHRIANLLVGNREDEATLEITLTGPTLRFPEAALIAISGAELSPRIGEHALPQQTPVLVRAGSQLDFGPRVSGLHAYLAVHGGFATAPVMNSRSTYVRGAFGGFDGRALRKGDTLPVAAGRAEAVFAPLAAKLRAGTHPFAAVDNAPKPPAAPGGSRATIRVMAGEEWDAFTPEAQRALSDAEFRLSLQSDRMGFRFEGPKLALRAPLEMISAAVAFGTMQVPPDGNPIVLMADRQTTGGYPKLANVASVDLPLLAQVAPREAVRFSVISLDDAQHLYLARERALVEFGMQVRELRRS